MPFRRGRKQPHSQCAWCFRIMRGRHRNTNPGRKVFYHDAHGTYATADEARAAGLDPDLSSAYGHGTDQTFDQEHAYGHTICRDCDRKQHAEHLELRRQRQEERMRQAESDDGEEG